MLRRFGIAFYAAQQSEVSTKSGERVRRTLRRLLLVSRVIFALRDAQGAAIREAIGDARPCAKMAECATVRTQAADAA